MSMIRTRARWSTLALACSFVLSSCATKPSSTRPLELTSEAPNKEFRAPAINDSTETIAILGTNDMHGALLPQSLKSREKEGVDPISYERGGATLLASHVRMLQKEWGNRLLLLDAGDCFQGSMDSNLEEGAPMVRLFNHLNWNASAIGNHEFDFGPVGPAGAEVQPNADVLGAIKARMSESNYTWLAANIVQAKNKQFPDFPNTVPSKIFQVGRLSVGVIGLSTIETPTTTRPDFVSSLSFTSLKEATLRESKKLREQGAQVVVITAHVGITCDLKAGDYDRKLRPVSSSTHPAPCDPQAEMVKLLRAIPKGTVDAVVSGHTHSMVHHTIEGVPVIQSGTRNVAYHMIYLQYDLKNRKVLPQNSMIDGPIPLCSRVFENQGDCNGDRPAPAHGRGKLVPAKFLGSKVEQDPETLALLEPTFKNTRAQKERVIANAVRAVEHDRRAESALGNLVTDAIREATHADFALVNPGGLRAPFEQGPITFEALFKTLPFDNMVSVVEVTGAELKRIIRIAESGSRGWFPVSGLKLKVLDLDSSARATDLNADGKTELWEVDRLIGITQFNGQAIDDQKRYRLATIDFLILGGDDMGHAFGSIPKERIHIAQGGILRDAVEAHMARLKNINSLESPLVDPRYPRLEVVKNYPSKKERQKSQKRRKKR